MGLCNIGRGGFGGSPMWGGSGMGEGGKSQGGYGEGPPRPIPDPLSFLVSCKYTCYGWLPTDP